MEVITAPTLKVGKELDEMAKRVFLEAIELAGGFRKVILFRNLTWVPSLAAASYAVILKNEFFFTKEKIAEFLGISKTTVDNILSANEREVEKYLEGILEKIDEHKAGGLAKLAYKRLKEEGRLKVAEISEETVEKVKEHIPEFAWPLLVLHAIRGIDFPAGKEEIAKALEEIDITINGKPLSGLIEKLSYPISSPAELLRGLRDASKE